MNHTLNIFFIIAAAMHITCLFSAEMPQSHIAQLIYWRKHTRLVLSDLFSYFPQTTQLLINEYTDCETEDEIRKDCSSFIPYDQGKSPSRLSFTESALRDQPPFFTSSFYVLNLCEETSLPVVNTYDFCARGKSLSLRRPEYFHQLCNSISLSDANVQTILRSFNTPPAAEKLCTVFDTTSACYVYPTNKVREEAIFPQLDLKKSHFESERSYYALRIILGLFSHNNIIAELRDSSIVQEGQRRSAVLLGPSMTHHDFACLLKTTLVDFMSIQHMLPKKSFAQRLKNDKWYGIGWDLDNVLARYDKPGPKGIKGALEAAVADPSLVLVFSPQ